MKYLIIPLIVLLMFCKSFASNDAYVVSQQRSIKVMPLYQSWTSNNSSTFSEITFPIYMYLPFSRSMSLSLRGSQATASGDYLQTLSGFTDTQLSFSYYLETYNLVLNFGANLPSGKKELSPTEFNTSSILSFNYFNFLVPNFGQGLNLSPGLTWAYPISDNFVLGFAASYQLKGKFKPIEGMIDDYNPGDEILITSGIDIRLAETTNLSADLIYITYGTDKIGDNNVFASGNMILANVQYRQYFNFNELRLFARYRSKGKNSLAVAGALVPESQKTTPDQIEVMGSYRQRFSQSIYFTLLAEGKFYLETPVFQGINVFGLGVAPEISLFSNLKVLMRFKYLIGKFKSGADLTGLEGGMGVSCDF